jgi:hypothetical protein
MFVLLDFAFHDHDLFLELVVLVLERVDFNVGVLVRLESLHFDRLHEVAHGVHTANDLLQILY